MRFYELARELKTSDRDLLRQAEALGLTISTVVSSIDDEDESAIRTAFKRPLAADIAREENEVRAALAAKSLTAADALRASIAAESAELRAAQERATAAIPQENPLDHIFRSAKPAAQPAAQAAKPAPEAPAESKAAAPASTKPATTPSPATAAPAASPAPAKAEAPVAAAPTPAPAAAKPAQPELAPAATRAIGGIAPLPVRTRTAPRPVFVPPPPPPKVSRSQQQPPQAKKQPVALHPGDARDEARRGGQTAHGGLQGAGGVSKATQRLRQDPLEARDLAREKSRDKRDRRAAERAAERATAAAAAASERKLVLRGVIVVKDLAEKLGLRPNQLITELMKMGILASINQSVDSDTAAKIAAAHGFMVEHEKSKRNAQAKPVMKDLSADDDIPEDRPDQLRPRPPVVTFLGHVDHGKTSLMDYIRKSSVAAGEAGGITQAISAYSVDVQGRTITFLDTPGHAAFSAMRNRGAHLTDIAVIIIAADDGIMPQTKEAIQQARDADVTIMVAINKCDLPNANPDRVMQQLQAENLTPEEWGGSTVVCKVSAKTGEGVPALLDMILLQADVLELSANPDRRANGSVIEASMIPGSGPAVSVLVTGGTLNVGDVMLCGEHWGRIRALTDSSGRRLKSAGPSAAVSVMGLSGVPEAGAEFRIMKNDKRARELAAEEAQRRKEELLGGVTQARSADEIFRQMHEQDKLVLNLILRADVQGSVEAIVDSIGGIQSSKVSCNIIQSGTGAIAVNDIERAEHGRAVVIGFNVSPESGVNALARHDGVRVKTFRIIYELLDFVKQEMLALLPVEHKEVVRGHAQVKQVFDLGKEGVVAGSLVLDGFITKKGQIRVVRRGKLLHSGPISTIRHFKETVEEVKQAQECGIMLESFSTFEEGDILECFAFEELPKTL